MRFIPERAGPGSANPWILIPRGTAERAFAKLQRLSCEDGGRFDVFSSLSGMNTRIFSGMCVAALLLLGGCVTGDRVWPEGTLAPAEEKSGEKRVWIE